MIEIPATIGMDIQWLEWDQPLAMIRMRSEIKQARVWLR